jgi:hypothetical protein
MEKRASARPGRAEARPSTIGCDKGPGGTSITNSQEAAGGLRRRQ